MNGSHYLLIYDRFYIIYMMDSLGIWSSNEIVLIIRRSGGSGDYNKKKIIFFIYMSTQVNSLNSSLRPCPKLNF